MNIITMEEISSGNLQDSPLDAVQRAIELFRPFVRSFFLIEKEEKLTWSEEMEALQEYRRHFSNSGCFLWTPGGKPVLVDEPQEFIINLRGMQGTVIVMEAAEIKKSGTVERSDGTMRITGREGIPDIGADLDVVVIAEDGGIEGGEEDILEDDEIRLISDAFSDLPNDLRIHWVIDGGLHVMWAEAVERMSEPETADKEEREEEEREAMEPVRDEPEPTIEISRREDDIRITATEIYAEFCEGDSIPEHIDGLIIPVELTGLMAKIPDRYRIVLKLEDKEGLEGILHKLKEIKKSPEIILPPVCNPEEAEEMLRRMEEQGFYSSRFRTMASIKDPCELLISSELAEVCDGLYVDLPALIDRICADTEGTGACILPVRKAIEMVQAALRPGQKAIYRIPAGDDIPALLVREGGQSVSCEPARIKRITAAIAREEQRILLKSVGLKG